MLSVLPPQIEYPEIEEGVKPRHRVMSSYEQRKEPWSRDWQYLLFAAEPYVSCAAAAGRGLLGGGGWCVAVVWLSVGGCGCHVLAHACGTVAHSCGPCARLCGDRRLQAAHSCVLQPPCHRSFPTHLLQEIIAFKLPSYEVEKHPEKLFMLW